MAKGQLVNCDMCGRDTRNRCRVCRKCMAGVGKHSTGQVCGELGAVLFSDLWELPENIIVTRDDEIKNIVANEMDGLING